MYESQHVAWSSAYKNSLPDCAFAVIEPDYRKGITRDKRCRHFPHHRQDGTLDKYHLQLALRLLSTVKPVTKSISQTELQEKARRHLNNHINGKHHPCP